MPLIAPGRELPPSGQADWLAAFHFNYTISGLGANPPTQAFDDGVSMWIEWAATRTSPLILAKGDSAPIGFKREGDYVRLSGVHEQLALQAGKEVYLITQRALEHAAPSHMERGADLLPAERWRPRSGPGPTAAPTTAPTTSWREHSYAIPLTGDTVRFEGQDEGAVLYRYGIDFLPHQSQLQAAEAKRVSAFLKTLPREARPELLCTPAGEGLGLSPGSSLGPSKRFTPSQPVQPMKPMKAKMPPQSSRLTAADQDDLTELTGSSEEADSLGPLPLDHARERRLTVQRWHYLLDLFSKAGLKGSTHKLPGVCRDTWVMEWRAVSATLLTARLPQTTETGLPKLDAGEQDVGKQRAPSPQNSNIALNALNALKTLDKEPQMRAQALAGAPSATRADRGLAGVEGVGGVGGVGAVGGVGDVGAEAAVESLRHRVLVEHRIHQGDLLHLALETLATSVGWTFLWYPGVSWRAIANIDLTPYGDPTQAVIALVKVMRQEGKAIQLRLSASNRVMEVLSTEVSHD